MLHKQYTQNQCIQYSLLNTYLLLPFFLSSCITGLIIPLVYTFPPFFLLQPINVYLIDVHLRVNISISELLILNTLYTLNSLNLQIFISFIQICKGHLQYTEGYQPPTMIRTRGSIAQYKKKAIQLIFPEIWEFVQTPTTCEYGARHDYLSLYFYQRIAILNSYRRVIYSKPPHGNVLHYSSTPPH